MKLLVTGGAGFIGSNFIRYWLENHPDDEIVNLDKLTYAGHIESTKDFSDHPNYKFVKGDICNPSDVSKITSGIDILVHFAAETHVDRSIVGPDDFVVTNVVGTQVLLDAALKNKIKKFHHISTDEVFGSLDSGSEEKFNENTIYSPRSPYAASKASSDHLVRAYFHTFGLPITITNCSNNFGPFQDLEKFISRMITDLIEGEKVKIYGDGKNVRDWLYVEDHVRAIEAVLTNGQVGETYLVGGSTEEISNLKVATMVLDLFKKDEDSIKFVKDRPGHDKKYAIDWTKINKSLGWKPKYGFSDWLEKTVEWYRKNEWWWKPLKKTAEELYEKTGQL